MARKPPPPGYERHSLDPNLIRKVQPPSAAQAMYPHLKSSIQPERHDPMGKAKPAEGKGR
jgi:hypothetical protein